MGNTETARRAIRVWLAGRETTQGWLADRVGITEGALSNILSGRKPYSEDLADDLLRVTGIDIRRFKKVA